MKLRKLTQAGISHYIVPVVAVVLVAVVGTFLLVRSHAETPSYLGFANYTMAFTAGIEPGKPITAINVPRISVARDFLPGIDAQYVSNVPPRAKLAYDNFIGKAQPYQVCYYVRVFDSPKSTEQPSSASITFVGSGNSLTRTLPADDNYRSVCVNTGSSTQANYNIWNRSSAAYVLVYEAVSYR